jgi:hypothetical protein
MYRCIGCIVELSLLHVLQRYPIHPSLAQGFHLHIYSNKAITQDDHSPATPKCPRHSSPILSSHEQRHSVAANTKNTYNSVVYVSHMHALPSRGGRVRSLTQPTSRLVFPPLAGDVDGFALAAADAFFFGLYSTHKTRGNKKTHRPTLSVFLHLVAHKHRQTASECQGAMLTSCVASRAVRSAPRARAPRPPSAHAASPCRPRAERLRACRQ